MTVARFPLIVAILIVWAWGALFYFAFNSIGEGGRRVGEWASGRLIAWTI